jgi:hypothetical protein
MYSYFTKFDNAVFYTVPLAEKPSPFLPQTPETTLPIAIVAPIGWLLVVSQN